MTAPSKPVRIITYARDSYQCINCGARVALEWNHRVASGMGGSKHKPGPHEGVTACSVCNTEFERNMLAKARRFGWRVRRYSPISVRWVPVFYPAEQAWFLLREDGLRDPLTDVEAAEYRGMAGI